MKTVMLELAAFQARKLHHFLGRVSLKMIKDYDLNDIDASVLSDVYITLDSVVNTLDEEAYNGSKE